MTNNNWVLPKHLPLKQRQLDIVKYFHLQLPNYLTDHLVINGGLVVESDGNGINVKYTKIKNTTQSKMHLFKRVTY
jgi:hypothetical protein